MATSSAASSDSKINELKDILVEEVSVVDRAANKRRFILVKRDGSLVMAEGAEVIEKENDQNEVDKAPQSPPEAKSDAPVPSAKQDDEEAQPSSAEASAKKSDDAGATEESLDEIEQSAKRAIAKAGARMSKDRFARFKQGVDLIMSVFNELSPAPGPGMKAKAEAPSVEPPQGAAASEPTKKVEDVPADTVDPRDALIEKLTGEVRDLTAVLKGTADRVHRIEKARGTGNARPAEATSQPVQKAVSWPSDMNKPINRDTVNKERWLD